MELSKTYDPKAAEEKIYQLWEKSGFFNPDNLPDGKPYVINLPPPNITGSLHMGHALNATITDVLIRFHRMNGYRAVWLPGIDHAGIATQNVVEKQLKKEGVSRWDIGREKFIEKVWQWKEKYGGIILGQLKKLGASCDWSRTRFTMDPAYADWVKKAFIHYYEKGLIYRGKRVVSWCPRCQTSLSDLEIEYKPEKTKLWHISYGPVTVATTRPETMLGDAAVAVNPRDERYKKLVGQKVTLPIVNRAIPVIADEEIDMTFGTGALKVTPAHSLIDAEMAERHKLPFYQVIDERGRMTAEAGKEFEGLKVLEAREKVVATLEKLGLLKKIEDYEHNLSLCYRCGTSLEPLLSDQWFLKMEDLAKKALQAAQSGQMKIMPANFEKPYLAWLEHIRDWCISRQIWWGHQLPVFFCQKKQEEFPIPNSQSPISSEARFIVTNEKPKQCPICKDCDMKQSEDVLDTWFSSALWPFAGLSDKDLKNFYPSNVLITARDIINLWVARMVFSGQEFMGAVPFPETLIHATVLTKAGQRMSKSLGTGIDPLELMDKYGADATRFGIIWQSMGTQDIHWDETAVQAGKKFANKLWNIARFVGMQTTGTKLEAQDLMSIADQNADDKNIATGLNQLTVDVETDIKNYELGQALHKIYDFTWHEFADKYIELTKQRQDEATKKTLLVVSLKLLKLLHPFMPFVTEEIYQQFDFADKQSLLMIESWK